MELPKYCLQDGKIRGYLPDVEDPLFLLEGHTENVTSLYASKFGTLISGKTFFAYNNCVLYLIYNNYHVIKNLFFWIRHESHQCVVEMNKRLVGVLVLRT
jgi:hypothetical protein